MTEGAFEDDAEDYATRAWLKMAMLRSAAWVGTVAGITAVVLCDYVFAVIAMAYLPWPVVAAVALVMGMELGGLAAHIGRQRRQPKPAVVTEGEKYTATLDRIKVAQAQPYWRLGWRSGAFWRGTASRTLYSGLFGFVIAVWAGSPWAGLAAVVGYTALRVALGEYLPRSQDRVVGVLAFGDVRDRPDTPEI
jgi:hypothetical protein